MMRWQVITKATILSAALMAMATGCHKKPKLPPPDTSAPTVYVMPPTASITADPLSIDLGQSVVLNWRTTNATSVAIDGIGQVPINGTQTVSPANSTNFHLVAKGDGGTVEANVRVTVRVPEVSPVTTGQSTGGDPNDMANVTDAAFHAAVPDVFFGYDSFELSPEGQTSVSSAAHYLTEHPGVKILIGGYCDDRGSAEYNITLGENRANSAKTALVSAGVAPNRIRVISYGKERQFCTEDNESCWQQNRRAQFTVDR
ncbi:OmpA family protein [Granulicella cerasi]|uniref:Peptidoglycan-associated lipoprotein n=1 Tax=Granulicella cerasi TaxID=741063 RepID=A0ABW1Z6J1_9BACT|nr:OmpA family protein [Granulicella cerasi]